MLHTAIMVKLFMTDHLFGPLAMTMKQFCLLPVQVVQKPSADSFHVPSPFAPALEAGSRVAFPSDVNSILNLTPDGVAAVYGCPVKKVD